MNKQIEKNNIVTWLSCNTIWSGKVVLVSGNFIEVDVINRHIRQFIKISDIIDVIKT